MQGASPMAIPRRKQAAEELRILDSLRGHQNIAAGYGGVYAQQSDCSPMFVGLAMEALNGGDGDAAHRWGLPMPAL